MTNIWDVDCIDKFHPHEKIEDREEEEEIIPVTLDEEGEAWGDDEPSETLSDEFEEE